MPTPQEKPFNFPLNGKLRTVDDGVLLGEGDFKELTNMRYGEYNPKTIRGMTKINAAATNYLSVQSGHHFKKDDITENHVIAQTTTSTNSRLVKSDNSTSIPAQDTFTAWLTLDNNNRVYPSKAPDSSAVFFNGTKNYVWGGAEARCPKFINFDPDWTFRYDYTEVVNNSATDATSVATMNRVLSGIDGYTKALWHFENNGTDSSGNSHTLTAQNGATYSNSIYKFGSYAASLDGTNDYFDLADHADFDLSGGTWSIDGWIYVTSVAAAQIIYSQWTAADTDTLKIYVGTDASIRIAVNAGGLADVTVNSAPNQIILNQWNHFEATESGDSWYIFVNGNLVATATDASRAANYTSNVSVGRDAIGNYFAGKIDELRVSVGIARHTSTFTPMTGPYGSTYQSNVYIGAIRPIRGAKFYVGTANATAATATAYYWNGTAWTAVASLVDGTASGGKTLAVTGSISFTDTSSVAKARLVYESFGYFYWFVFDSADAATTVSRVTLDMAPQGLVDIWDGIFRNCLSFFKYTTSYNDYTVNTLDSDYVSSDPLSYAQLGGLAAYSSPNNCVFAGFTERVSGLRLIIPDETYKNVTAATVMMVEYWNGAAWTSVGVLSDGTASGGISMTQTGTVTWNPLAENTEFKTTIGNGSEYYYYRIRWNQELDNTGAGNDVRLDTVYGIPVQKTIKPYRFPAFWQNRIWLFGNQYGAENTGLCSAYGTVCVFNGSDSVELEFDGGTEVVAAVPLFTRYGGTTYENLLVCKKNATYLVDGTTPADYKVIEISTSEGCVAPLTMRACDLGYEVAPGITKHVAIWLSASGVVMFDGSVVSTISGDIQDRFQSWKANYINTSQVATFYGEYDMVNREYHLMIATGSSTTLNEEWVYDLLKKKWYLVDRGATKRLVSAFPVTDSYGNFYLYGGTSDGYIERLEYGTTFDGTNITSTMNLGDVPLSKTPLVETEMKKVRLVGVAKTTTTNTVALTHYADTATSGTSLTAITPTATGKRVYIKEVPVNQRGIFHGLKFVMITSDETTGFEPLVVSGTFRATREEHLSA